MRFYLPLLSTLVASAIAGPLTSVNENSKVLALLERSASLCDCYPDCGCPTNTQCLCQDCAPPIRPPCYPDCGCSGSAVCVGL
ncbi:hypothetical protein N7540_010931 [Penicillium herquei]|nr:hypothetical protein N7540_010931 [Penicillium herquei]